MMRVIGIAAAVLLLAACDGAAEADAEAQRGTVPVEQVAAQRDTLPEGLALPPDTQIAQQQQVTMANGGGWVVLLDSTLTPAALEAHFRSEAEAAGFALEERTNSAGKRQVHGTRADGMQFDFAAEGYPDGSTRASLAVGRSN